ncbi:hypothetical protein [Bradyrhizobium sp. RDM4]|uniref:hypothetical protein n=1 Tax=Bradyrhizobium sp. RDM4 TaxID=3378765 RepID=UPI0038FC4B6F
MKVCIVRHIETREFQGIFWGKSIADIWDVFDELGDPSEFEYAALKAGALYTRAEIDEGQKIVQLDSISDPEEAGPSVDWSSFEPSEQFDENLRGQDDLRWRRFDYASQGHGLLARICRRLDDGEGPPT